MSRFDLGRLGRRPTRRAAGVFLAVAAILGIGGLAAHLSVPLERPDPVLITSADWRAGSAGSSAVAQSPDAWLASGTVPGDGGRWADMVRDALLDLRALSRPDGAVSAGAADRWSYVWPRDNAFVAAALAKAGHAEEAAAVLEHLAHLPFDDDGAGFEARYTLDGVGPPDGREAQSDGAGWYLWALWQVNADLPAPALTPGTRAMLDRCTDLLLRLTDGGAELPPPSPDYWEVPVHETTLGTAAPAVAGLRSAARLYAGLGDPGRELLAEGAAHDLAGAVFEEFGGPWERFGHLGGLDAAVAFVMPPFAPETRDVALAWARYQALALRPAGGLAPGEEWTRDGISWTPETALVAYTSAASDRDALAAYWLDWLDEHRTTWGSLPEKVTASGKPAGPAPLAWTAALVVLSVAELDS
jgi:GH15 family glucan-1,4-alpha-glucosidase